MLLKTMNNIIFVDDASTDNSLGILLNHRKENKNIKIITTSRTFGVSPRF